MSDDHLNDDGYELAHYQAIEYGSGRTFGIKVFVKMSNRGLVDQDRRAIRRKADEIVKDLDIVTAQLDPGGPAKRAALRAEVEEIYRAAGVSPVYVEEIPNGYCHEPCCLHMPWFRVTSRIGHLVIGWRKNVMSIDWRDTVVKMSGRELFPHEDVTRLETGIHAWGTKKAVEYVKALHDVQREWLLPD